MGKPTICIGENKGADQLRSSCEADQRLCVYYADSTIPLLYKSKISSLKPSSVTVQAGLCRTWSEPKIVNFLTHRLISSKTPGGTKRTIQYIKDINHSHSEQVTSTFHIEVIIWLP